MLNVSAFDNESTVVPSSQGSQGAGVLKEIGILNFWRVVACTERAWTCSLDPHSSLRGCTRKNALILHAPTCSNCVPPTTFERTHDSFDTQYTADDLSR